MGAFCKNGEKPYLKWLMTNLSTLLMFLWWVTYALCFESISTHNLNITCVLCFCMKCETSFGIVQSALVVCDSIGLVQGNEMIIAKLFQAYPWVIKMIVFDWSIIMIHTAWLRWWHLRSLSLYFTLLALFIFSHLLIGWLVLLNTFTILNEWANGTLFFSLRLKFNFQKYFKLKLFLNFLIEKFTQNSIFPMVCV
jgi:hypothetical protein